MTLKGQKNKTQNKPKEDKDMDFKSGQSSLNCMEQQVVDALCVALALYTQKLPDEIIEHLNTIGNAIDKKENKALNVFFWEMESYPLDFQEQYDQVKQKMQAEEVSQERNIRIEKHDLSSIFSEDLAENVLVKILQDTDPQTKAKEVFSPDFLVKFLPGNKPKEDKLMSSMSDKEILKASIIPDKELLLKAKMIDAIRSLSEDVFYAMANNHPAYKDSNRDNFQNNWKIASNCLQKMTSKEISEFIESQGIKEEFLAKWKQQHGTDFL